jgi:glycosidase
LAPIYGADAAWLSAQIDDLVAAHRRADTASSRWSEADAWLIAYPDHFGPKGLDDVGRVVDELAPEINGVHVLPFHPASGDGGFSVTDYAEVDPAVGDWRSVEAIADRHRLMADAVVNHVSAQGVWFLAHLSGEGCYDRYFRRVADNTDMTAVVRPRPGPALTSFERADGTRANYWATFSADQVDLDVRAPEVLLEIVRAILRFVDHGATAIRLDAIAFLWKDPATSSMHLPETHAIVAVIRGVLDDVRSDMVLITETNVPHDDNVAYFGSAAAPEAHAVYQFSLAPLVLHAVQTGDVAPLRRWAASVDAPPATTYMNSLASHDGVGVRPARGWLSAAEIEALAERCRAVGGGVNTAATADGEEPYELNATWWSLCGWSVPAADRDVVVGRVLAAHAVALALRGIPLLYAHSLVGAENDVAGANRTGVARDINRARFASAEDYLALANDDHTAGAIWSGLRAMLSMRRSSPAFHPEAAQFVWPASGGAIVIERSTRGQRALVVVNLGRESEDVEIGSGWVHMDGSGDADARATVPPWGAFWFKT